MFFPRSIFQFTTGVSVPVSMNKRGSVVFSSAFQFNYKLPSNLSELEPTIIPARQSRDLNLQDTYAAIENLLNRWVFRDFHILRCGGKSKPPRRGAVEGVKFSASRFESFRIMEQWPTWTTNWKKNKRAVLPFKIARWIGKHARIERINL